MFCSGCGSALVPGQAFCPQCGRPVTATPVPPGVPPTAMPGFQFELNNFAGRIRALSVVWFIFGGLTLVAGFVKLAFLHALISGHGGPWSHGWIGPFPQQWFGPALLHFAWLFLLLHAGMALIAGWGLLERQPWGKVLAIVTAIFNVFEVFPFGIGMCIWTLVMLLGYRNSTLYNQLAQGSAAGL